MSLFYLAYLNYDIQTHYTTVNTEYASSTAGFKDVVEFHYKDSQSRLESYFNGNFDNDKINYFCSPQIKKASL